MTASAAWEEEDDHDEEAALEDDQDDIPGVRPGEGRTGLVHVRARLKVVVRIWRADPPLVLAVNSTEFVDPSAEIEILQRHHVVAANLVFRGHLVKLYREMDGVGGEVGKMVGRECEVKERVRQPPRCRWLGSLAPSQ